MKVKVTHKECFARQTVGVFKEVGKLIEKHGVREFVLFAGWTGAAQVANNTFFSVLCSSRLLRSTAALNTLLLNTGST